MEKTVFIDQLGCSIQVNHPPKRIISIVPSQTELLYDLGLNEEIIGITKFCIHPKDKFKNTTKIGGTKKLDIKKIRSLKPDLIIGNKEENLEEDINLLKKEFPVWISDISDLNEALKMVLEVGKLVDKENNALNLVENIIDKFKFFEDKHAQTHLKSTLYFIWQNPNMAVGKSTFINEMFKYCGLENIIQKERYPILSDKELYNLNPIIVLLSSEPYPFKQKHILRFKEIWPNAKIRLVDGEMFSWYGSRLLKAADYFKELHFNLNN